MRRLTKNELLQSMTAVLGAEIMAEPAVQQASALIPEESSGDLVHEFQNGHAFDHVQGLLLTAHAAAGAVVSNATVRSRLFGACADKPDAACVAAFLDENAVRILRRPPSSVQLEALLAAFGAAGGGAEGLRLVLASLWQAPEAVFHLELPRRECDPSTAEEEAACPATEASHGRIALDDWSIASRVSFTLTGQGPDDELLAAAGRGELRSLAEVRTHAERLASGPLAARQLDLFFDSWLKLRALPTPDSIVATAAGVDGADLGNEAREELLAFASYEILQRDADLATLMSDAVGFPRSERMAKLYGSAVAVGDEPVALPEGHRGLLLRIAPLLSGKTSTSPILRGVYVRKRLLCDELASPDFAIISARTEALQEADTSHMSTREIAANITSPATCMTCHVSINPLGFALEDFDPLGRPREAEAVFDAAGAQIAHHPVDSRVERPNIESGGPEALDGATELNDALAHSAKLRACFAERLYTTAHLHAALEADACAISDIERALRSGKSIKDAWVESVVNDDLFWRNAEETP
jgi:hypothetical protein